MACDPNSLLSDSKCLVCIPNGMQLPVLNLLAAQSAGASTDPNTLLSSARLLDQIPNGMRWRAVIAVACQIAGV